MRTKPRIKFLVASVTFGRPGQEVDHAMVLDKYDRERDVFIFKNTYDDPNNGLPKKFEIGRNDPNAPEELYFVHIEVEDMSSLPSQQQRITDQEKLRRARK